MRFEKQVTVAAPRQTVWDFLWDVPRLTACIPGCEQATTVEPYKRYRATVQDRVGPFKIKVPLDIEVLEAAAPERLVALATGHDPVMQSRLKVELDLTLDAPNAQTTTLHFRTDVTVMGKLGTLGHSMIVRRGDAVIEAFATAIQSALMGEGD
ncbi:MAG: SRPBCC domain-containing protein [bacterium]|nr:SRPBCC domain-containing protein [bacterium]